MLQPHTLRDHLDRGEAACLACLRELHTERPYVARETEAERRRRTRIRYQHELVDANLRLGVEL